ncbi:hypothetical protein JCM13591A_02560 [Microbacterium xylanilyticum]
MTFSATNTTYETTAIPSIETETGSHPFARIAIDRIPVAITRAKYPGVSPRTAMSNRAPRPIDGDTAPGYARS